MPYCHVNSFWCDQESCWVLSNTYSQFILGETQKTFYCDTWNKFSFLKGKVFPNLNGISDKYLYIFIYIDTDLYNYKISGEAYK